MNKEKKERIEKQITEINIMLQFLVHMSEDEDDEDSCCERDLNEVKILLHSMTGFDE